MTIQANQGFGVSIFGATSAGGGGSTSPGGSSGQLQYNASGSFGGMAGTSWDDTNRALTLTGATVTTSQPVLNLSQTWNAGAVTFTGLKFNATDTASAAGSLLLDLQVGGTSQFGVSKVGVVSAFSYSGATGGYSTVAFHGNANSSANAAVRDNVGFTVRAANVIGWVSNTNAGSGTVDLSLTRAAAATLQLGAADAASPAAQTLQVQSVVAGTSNTAGANFTINGSRGTGTGTGGSIIFQVAPAGSSGTAQNAYASVWQITGAGHLTCPTDNTYDIGASGASRPRNIYAGSSVFGSGLYATSIIQVTASAGRLDIGGDASLYRDAANTLANRNGTSAQKFRVYNTYTSSTNYENFEIDWQTTANTALVGPTKGSGGGTQRVQRLQYLEDGGTGSTTPSLGTTCPAASATIKSWIKVVTSDGTTAYIPCWA